MDSLALANPQLNLDKTYKNFFRDKSVEFPRFKSKKNPVQSYTTNNQNGTIALIDNKFGKLPKLSRSALLAKKKGIDLFEAKNYQKQKRKIARFHEKVMNHCTDFLNKLSTEIIKNHNIICIEDLNTKSISDVSWSSFVTQLKYKADWYGRKIIKVNKWFPSSQICSKCGHKDGKKSLEIREWTCPIYHAQHDRDINASINILTKFLYSSVPPRFLGRT